MRRNLLLGVFVVTACVAGSLYFGQVSAQKADPATKVRKSALRPESSTPQTLPFSQNWTSNLITTNDDWSPVPGIEGFLGQDITTSTGIDPRNLLTTSVIAADLDVIANQTNPDTLTSGGVAEFDTLANPTIAFQGSGTADVPNLILYLNTTGQNNIRVSYNARDIDGSADNAIQPINTQYRVGSTGNFINVPGGYIADATTGPNTATLVTPVAVTLPAAANNQPLVQVRIMTTNAAGSDEWVGIDDISVTTVATPAVNKANVDFNGDGRSDYVVTRTVGGSMIWSILETGTGVTSGYNWGLSTDREVPADYDGDGKSDIAIWREAPAAQAKFYILRSSNFSVQIETFGQTNDDPSVVGDYDGDGKADVATYRCPTPSAGPCTWFYRGTLSNPSGSITYVPWGNGVSAVSPLPANGDYDGDGKNDFCVWRDSGGGQGQYVLMRSTDGGIEWINWGLTTDAVIPASDFDGDGKTDFAVARIGDPYRLFILERDGGGTGANPISFGSATANDDGAFGDYDGDGKQDIGIWRPNADPTQNFFWIRLSSTGVITTQEWGQSGDNPSANWIFPR